MIWCRMSKPFLHGKAFKYAERLALLTDEEVEGFRQLTRKKEERIVKAFGVDTDDPEWLFYTLPEGCLEMIELVTGDRTRALIHDTMRRSAQLFSGPIYATMPGYYL